MLNDYVSQKTVGLTIANSTKAIAILLSMNTYSLKNAIAIHEHIYLLKTPALQQLHPG